MSRSRGSGLASVSLTDGDIVLARLPSVDAVVLMDVKLLGARLRFTAQGEPGH